MATDKYPQQNHNMPMDPAAVEAARAALAPPYTAPPPSAPTSNGGNGSRREVRKGEWVDDRVINIGGPSSPSKDSPPDIATHGKSGRAVPGTYDPLKAYQVTLGKPIVMYGRALSPAKSYQMQGDVCTEITTKDAACIVDAVELGDVPTEPDIAPSAATATGKTEQGKKKA